MPPPVPPPLPAEEPQGMMWALVPFLTFGFGTPFSFLYAATRTRSAYMGVSAGAYGLGLGTMLALSNSGSAALETLGLMLIALLWIGGSVHAFAVRPTVYPRRTPSDRVNEHAVEIAKYRRRLREQARALAADDPALAHELRIGRPDLPRTYDDGGLIDVNHVPGASLALLPGMTTEYVDRVLEVRTEQGAFISAEEMAVHADLPPEIVNRLAEYALFLP